MRSLNTRHPLRLPLFTAKRSQSLTRVGAPTAHAPIAHAPTVADAETVRREAEFKADVAGFEERYRAMGSIATQFDDPIQPLAETPAAGMSLKTIDRWMMVTCVQSISGMSAALFFAFTQSLFLFSLTAVVAVTGFIGAWWAEKEHDRAHARLQPPKRRIVRVRKDVGTAYEDYIHTIARLRTVDASEVVVAGIEAQAGFAVDLLHESVRLHAAGASASVEAVAVRDTMLGLAANAMTLAQMAERQHREVTATAVADPLLLSRTPDVSGFAALSHIITDETQAAHMALTASSRCA